MTVDVYVDLLFMINAVMDALCLGLTARLLHRRLSRLRTWIAAAIGGLYAVLSLFWIPPQLPLGLSLTAILDVGVCLLLCLCAFGGRTVAGRSFLLLTAVYVAVSMAMGGIMTALYHLLNRFGLPALLGEPQGEDGLSALLFALLAGVSGVVTAWGGRVFRKANAISICRVEVRLGMQTVAISGMVDSGNLLRDPMGGKPVITVDRRAIAPLLSPALKIALSSHAPSVHGLSHEEQRRLRFIPTATATGQGLLPAFLPDEIILTPEGKSPHTVSALVALTDLTEAPAPALVPTELVL